MEIQNNIPLDDKNWFKTGGNARFFAEPASADEFCQALAWARGQDVNVFVLGAGANILISDNGFDGLVVRPQLQHFSADHEKATITAGAGVDLADLINKSLGAGLKGLEEFSGIPGTVGGALYINIHYFEFLLSRFVLSAQIVDMNGIVSTVDAAWFNFGYNTSTLLECNYFVVSATFQLMQASELEIAYACGRRDEMIRHRRQRYPYERTCGSFFRNFHAQELELATTGKKLPFVAYYLDKLGVKGELRVGNAIVSHKHANMIETLPGATSNDVVQLVRTMQEMVHAQFGLIPQPECQLIGFGEYPLHQEFRSHPVRFFDDTVTSIEP